MKPVPSTLKVHRERYGLSQFELGHRLGVSQQTVARWESGGFPIDLDSVEKLEDVLRVDRSELFPTFFAQAKAKAREILPPEMSVNIGGKIGIYRLARVESK